MLLNCSVCRADAPIISHLGETVIVEDVHFLGYVIYVIRKGVSNS